MLPKQAKSAGWITLIYGILLAAGIPWYWPVGHTQRLLGVPAWVAVAIVVSMLTSIFTAWLLLAHPWPGEHETGSEQ